MLGISVGSMALQYLLTPKPKQAPVDKGKFDDIRIQGSDYGAFIPRFWGGPVRFAGNLVFSDGITHTIINSPSGGGKGVPQAPATRTHVYTTDMGVLICRSRITNFLRIWQDADLLLGNGTVSNGLFEAEDAVLTGTAAIQVDSSASNGEYVNGLGNNTGSVTFDFSSIPDPPHPGPSPDPDEFAVPKMRISFFYKTSVARTAVLTFPGGPVTASFPATGGNWTTMTAIFDGFSDSVIYGNPSAPAADLDVVTIEKYWEIETFPTSAPLYKITGNINPDIVYPTNLDDPSEYYNAPVTADGTGKFAVDLSQSGNIRMYSGTETQTADSVIQAWLDRRYGTGQGVLRTSAMRGLSYLILDNFQLRQGRVPNFSFEVQNGDSDVNEILEDLFADVNLLSSEFNITATAGLDHNGFIEATQTSRKSLIDSLAKYFQFRIGEIDGKVTTIVDTAASIATIDIDLLRAHDHGEEMPGYDAEIVTKEDHLLPREVRVSFMNPNQEFHNETATAQFFANINGTESEELTFPLVDEFDNVRLVAEKLLYKRHAETSAYEFWGMPEMAKYAIGDVITIPINGVDRNMRIEKKQRTLPLGKIRFQCLAVKEFVPTAYQSDTTALSSLALGQIAANTFPRNTVVFAIQGMPVRDQDVGRLGVYLAIGGRGRGAGENSGLYREFDDDNFILQKVIDTNALLGLCEDTLATHSPITSEDTTNVLDIWFFDDIELESVTAPDLARHPQLNLIRVGGEWLQFRTATAQTLEADSPYRSKWRISNLTRGLFGTQTAVSTHAASEYAAVYTPAMVFYDLEQADIGQTVTVKAVTAGQLVENATETSFVFTTPVRPTSLFDYYEDATTITDAGDLAGAMWEDLYSDFLEPEQFKYTGDEVQAEYFVNLAINANRKQLRVAFGGTVIAEVADGSAITQNGGTVDIYATVMRNTDTSVRCSMTLVCDQIDWSETIEIGTLDFTEELNIKLQGKTEDVDGDLTAFKGKVTFHPAAIDDSIYLTNEAGDQSTNEAGDDLIAE